MEEENKYEPVSLTFTRDELPLLNKLKDKAIEKDWSVNKTVKNIIKDALKD